MDDVTGYFLAGSSYPADRPFEQALTRHLAQRPGRCIGQTAIDPTHDARHDAAPGARAAALATLIEAAPRTGRTVLFGRSSGARAVSLCAGLAAVDVVICVSYPFRRPGRLLEPERFAHLATIRTPTLIVQGTADEYGGEAITDTYCLSEFVELHFIPGAAHAMELGETAWDALAQVLERFIRRATGPRRPFFDEAFYLRCYPEVAALVAAGWFASGAQHYREHGRAERRRIRQPAFG